jgi:hypothetical protein
MVTNIIKIGGFIMRMTWNILIKREPRLLALYRKASSYKKFVGSGERWCANRVWYRDFKPELLKLVGYDAENWLLNDSESYDIAYDKIYDALPDCNHDDGMCI